MSVILPALQDAVVLARKVHDLLHPQSESKGAQPMTLRSVATPDLVQVLREYEKERKARTRLITIRSNLMGQALQIPFAPVSSSVGPPCWPGDFPLFRKLFVTSISFDVKPVLLTVHHGFSVTQM